LQNLSGYTYLVNELEVVMDDIKNEKFNRTQVNKELLKEYVGGKVFFKK
jgi:hypothetical protein